MRYTDGEYPVLLKQAVNPPYMIFYRGNTDAFSQKSVSVVGTRRISPEGRKACFDFAYQAALSGTAVVSGLASGADGFAHKGAVEAYFDVLEKNGDTEALGKTIAVLPSSIDVIMPHTNQKLAENILKSGGCLVSQYAPMCEFGNWHYVQRNRIIAALSPATVVVEAPNGSGALITADFALELGRDLMFHEVTFKEGAGKIREIIKTDLENRFALGQVSRHKLESSADSFVFDGAPVIKDYEDYCKCLAEMPGIRSADKIEQLSLFE